MFGSHLSIAGGMHLALTAARDFELECVQVFTKNQRQWSVKPLKDDEVRAWHEHRKSTSLACVVSHDSYLINLANPQDDAWTRSMALFREELVRCEALEIPYLVSHPGAHVGSGEDAGLARIVAAFDRLHAELPGLRTITCLEITAGQGTCLGHKLEHLRHIIDHVKQPERLAVCLDTAHLLEAGYDLTSADGTHETLHEIERVLGKSSVRVLHVNDSKTPRGSRVDRHEHIGQGHIPESAWRVFLSDPVLSKLPKIMETPKDGLAPDGRDWDLINVARLREWSVTPSSKPAIKSSKKSRSAASENTERSRNSHRK